MADVAGTGPLADLRGEAILHQRPAFGRPERSCVDHVPRHLEWLRVSYTLQLVAGRSINVKQGRTATGSAMPSLRLKVGTHTRRIRLTIDAGDAVGNQASFAKTLRLRR